MYKLRTTDMGQVMPETSYYSKFIKKYRFNDPKYLDSDEPHLFCSLILELQTGHDVFIELPNIGTLNDQGGIYAMRVGNIFLDHDISSPNVIYIINEDGTVLHTFRFPT